jgi:hypothetical protein
MIRRSSQIAIVLLLIGLVVSARRTAAQTPAPGAFELKAIRVAEPPDIDGVVEDDEWKDAARATGFVQFEPRRGEPASRRTEAFVLYDAEHLYVAFRCWDDEPLAAQLTQRDADLFSDDSVGLLIDTSHDRQTAYFFVTNPLGTQEDGRLIDDGNDSDTTWDAPWKSAAARTDYGWSAKFAIPLTSIKYAAGRDVTWGINLGRTRRRTLEFDTWSYPIDATGRVSQAGLLAGLDLEPPARRHQVIPYALAQAQQDQPGDFQAGVDARYNVTTQTAVYGTLNPDFADQADLEVNHALHVAAKRGCLEGAGCQRIAPSTRGIAVVLGGGRLLGKQGPGRAFLTTQPIYQDLGRANFTVRQLRGVFNRSIA